jgi:O-antigen/teichoic acid export membrane protein
VASNVSVQAVGPASSFLTIFVIARLGGASAQGQYAQLRSWVDLLAALGCFGFPQGFIYVINKLRSSARMFARWSGLYTLALLPILMAGSMLALRLGLLSTSFSTSSVALLALAAAMLVLHGLWRGIYLTYNPGLSFATFTVLPAIALLVGCTAAMVTGFQRFDWVIPLSFVPMILAAAWMMRPIVGGAGAGRYRDQPWRALIANGLQAFLQAMLLTLQPIIAYRMVKVGGGADREVGFLNVGFFLVQGLTVPISMVAPLLFARWTSVSDEGLMKRLHAMTLRVTTIGAAVGLLLALAAQQVVPLVFGSSYASAVHPTQAMLLTVPLLCHVRVIEPAFHAQGRPGINTIAGAIRVSVFTIGALFVTQRAGGTLLGIAVAWTVANVLAAGWTLANLRWAVHGSFAQGAPESP